MDYEEFFGCATGGKKPYKEPYKYQRTLAESPLRTCAISVPTGAGKTAATILAWLWKRHTDSKNTPRRLAYCLPMRALVEQTHELACAWVRAVGMHIPVYLLMGGDVQQDWETKPEDPAILIGTQDMLLSRALNRGYAMSRYQWPVHFGLLNNDVLFVCDEVQLMSSGLATSIQLEAWRGMFGTIGPRFTWWMSATLNTKWLRTVDHDATGIQLVELEEEDRKHPEMTRRYSASKPLRIMELAAEKELARIAVEHHKPGSLTLVVVNTVERAQKTYAEVEKRFRKTQADYPELVLLHSRYRAAERRERESVVRSKINAERPGRIIIATQVVEAGLDISARTLITDIAPWASLVQRFGRCNRAGEFDDNSPAEVIVTEVAKPTPYAKDQIDEARSRLEQLRNASLETLVSQGPPQERVYSQVIRRKDLLDLFDTTPDLTGADIDVSRYIREDEETDVQVFWRDVEGAPERSEPDTSREELCPVLVSSFREFLSNHDAYRFDLLEERWMRTVSSAPGQTYLIRATDGGYSRVGWDPKSTEAVTVLPPGMRNAGYSMDRASHGPWRKIAEHTDNVCNQLKSFLEDLPLLDREREALRIAARWHDRGKAHLRFQFVLPCDEEHQPGDWAKAKGRFRRYTQIENEHWRRRYFRHELASGLAVLQERSGLIGDSIRSLVAYLAAAHHGKVRLSIRSMPGESPAEPAGTLFARGIWDGDLLTRTTLGGGIDAPEVRLSLECMQLGSSADGAEGWAERVLALRDDPALGPFRLAYLEAVLRAADRRASRQEGDEDD